MILFNLGTWGTEVPLSSEMHPAAPREQLVTDVITVRSYGSSLSGLVFLLESVPFALNYWRAWPPPA